MSGPSIGHADATIRPNVVGMEHGRFPNDPTPELRHPRLKRDHRRRRTLNESYYSPPSRPNIFLSPLVNQRPAIRL